MANPHQLIAIFRTLLRFYCTFLTRHCQGLLLGLLKRVGRAGGIVDSSQSGVCCSNFTDSSHSSEPASSHSRKRPPCVAHYLLYSDYGFALAKANPAAAGRSKFSAADSDCCELSHWKSGE